MWLQQHTIPTLRRIRGGTVRAKFAKPAFKVAVEAAHENLLRGRVADAKKPVATHTATRLHSVSHTNSSSTRKPKSMKSTKKHGKWTRKDIQRGRRVLNQVPEGMHQGAVEQAALRTGHSRTATTAAPRARPKSPWASTYVDARPQTAPNPSPVPKFSVPPLPCPPRKARRSSVLPEHRGESQDSQTAGLSRNGCPVEP